MEMTTYAPGTPSWIDVGTSDLDGASAFYSGLFGWEISEGPPEAGGYRMCMLKGAPVAGMGPQMNMEIPPYWASYVSVADADATVAAAKEAGGSVLVDPMDVLTAGRMAIIADPFGAVISIWQAGDHAGSGLVNEHGTLCWNELMTTEVEGSKAFYAAVFGWGARTSDGEMVYTEFQLGDRSIAGMMDKPADLPPEVPNMWMIYIAVDDTDAAVAKVQELGGAVMMPPMDIEPGRFATVADPFGAVFNVMTMKPGLMG